MGYAGYREYVDIQTADMSHLIKPEHYSEGERRAIKILFSDIPKHYSILDVGCALGQGMFFLKELGYDDVHGVELNPRKAAVARSFNLPVTVCDIKDFQPSSKFDVVYCSHTFEHMYDPIAALDTMKLLAHTFIFILPYPDLNPAPAHAAAMQIGTNKGDGGKSVIKFFEDQGLEMLWMKMDEHREPEIWLKLKKKS